MSPNAKTRHPLHVLEDVGATGSYEVEEMLTTHTSKLQTTKPRRTPQSAETRSVALSAFDDALAIVGQIEASAGPSLQEELARSKRVQAAYQSGHAREQFRRRRLGHRSGLVRLMINELGPNPELSDRARYYVEQILKVSANVAAVTGSPWKSTRSWLRSEIPAITDDMAINMKATFDTYVEEAQVDLAKRIPSGDPNLFTGPTQADLAKDLSITHAKLQKADASRCGLTSIDPPDRKASDRKRKAEAREKAGMRKQDDRSDTAIMKELAGRLGCSLATAYRRRGGKTLDAFVVAHGHDEKEVSAVINTLESGQNFLTPPANDDTPQPAPTPSLTEADYIDQNMLMKETTLAA